MFDTRQSDPNGAKYFEGEGTHHLHVVRVYDDGDKWEVYLKSLASADAPEDVGAGCKHTLWKPDPSKPDYIANAINSALEFCCAVGLYSKAQWAADKKDGAIAQCDPMEAAGREFVGRIVKNRKGYPALARTWNLTDPDVQAVPRGNREGGAPATNGRQPAMAGAGAGAADDLDF